jgi:hypothetical protein
VCGHPCTFCWSVLPARNLHRQLELRRNTDAELAELDQQITNSPCLPRVTLSVLEIAVCTLTSRDQVGTCRPGMLYTRLADGLGPLSTHRPDTSLAFWQLNAPSSCTRLLLWDEPADSLMSRAASPQLGSVLLRSPAVKAAAHCFTRWSAFEAEKHLHRQGVQ